ncbi:hypothetical protein DFJ63DRAFT_257104 [Scheffersomyces coipomensis]|uniref:uncharacterized protein n=1 Tax=Scheffersomyces coipomensis TaxID=1788519 RepID=UPI00315CFD32
MDDTDKPDPILKQVPLIKNPSYQTPKSITLKTNYGKLIPTLSNTVIPPNINITDADIQKWVDELESIKSKIVSNPESEKFKEWISLQKIKVAPGFESFEGVMQPRKNVSSTVTSPIQQNSELIDDKKDGEQEVNEIDKLFGKVL